VSKLIKYINSDNIDPDDSIGNVLSLKFAISFGTWMLIFFDLVPILITIAKNSFNINHQAGSALSGTIDIVLYYVLNPIIATLIVKWQNKKLANKTIKFKKIYCLFVSLIFLILTLFQISSYFLTKT
jgi:hypothetical protein